MELATTPRSQIRYRPIHPTRSGAATIAIPRTSAHPSRVLSRFRQQQQCQDQTILDTCTTSRYQRYQAPDTYGDEEIAPIPRTGRTKVQPATPYDQQPLRKEWHPLVWVSLTLFGMWLFWIATTVGLCFWATHVTDPGTYGPTHGNVINVVLGGGDSEAQPSKLIAMNNGGRIEIIMLLANDPKKAQIITGPDLVKTGFPDPVNAEVSLSAGKGYVQVTIYSTVYDVPFHRYQQPYTLVEDGQGNLKSQQQ